MWCPLDQGSPDAWREGDTFSDLILSHGYHCDNKIRGPTFEHLGGGGSSWIDVTFSRGLEVFNWEILPDRGLSDHYPIIYDFALTTEPLCPKSHLAQNELSDFSFYSCDWEKYKQFLQAAEPTDRQDINSGASCEVALNHITSSIQAAFKKASRRRKESSLPSSRFVKHRNDWWDDDLKTKRTELKKAERGQDSELRKKLRNEYRSAIIKKKSEALNRALDSIETTGDNKDIFKAFKSRSPYTPLTPLEGCAGMDETADQFADCYLGDLLEPPQNLLRATVLPLSDQDARFEFTADDVKQVLDQRRS
ncbi:hypothetical protein Pmar_PMAR015223, partial [Perkinsus marinus ATCC 50983]